MGHSSNKNNFSITSRVNSLKHALRGIRLFFKSQHNAWVQLIITLLVSGAGCFFSITKIEWILVIGAIVGVFSAEAFNTAIEIHMDLTSPNPHPHARNTKDVAAGAVLLAAVGAGVIGALIFIPYLFDFFL